LSTKIYEAFRFPREHLDEFLTKMDTIVFDGIHEYFSKILEQTGKKVLVDGEPEDFLVALAEYRFGHRSDWDAKQIKQWVLDNRQKAILMWLLSDAFLNARAGYRWGNLDCSINLWPHGEYYYCIPYMSDEVPAIKAKDFGEWFEFFGYWNNSDAPDDFMEGEDEEKRQEAWDARGDLWDEVMGDHPAAPSRLQHVFLEGKEYPWVGFSRVLARLGILEVEEHAEHITYPSLVNSINRRIKEDEDKKEARKNPPKALRIPIKAGRKIAMDYGYDQVFITAWNQEKDKQHVTTFGRTMENCDQVAQIGNWFKEQWGWPKLLCEIEPKRVQQLRATIKNLKDEKADLIKNYEERFREQEARIKELEGK
jgi:hypothetical protein